ncbi:MAG: hypothetical protein J6B50_00140 [Lachnospiraceae bacterium]|nr:hypothetical protein [Lachnospiraceae bacterium]MBP3594386.1 hypothetical protein [Lachnospiraceae bacterium]
MTFGNVITKFCRDVYKVLKNAVPMSDVSQLPTRVYLSHMTTDCLIGMDFKQKIFREEEFDIISCKENRK